MSTTAIQADGHAPPDLTSADRQSLRDLWNVYDGHFDQISQEAEQALADDPEFGPLIRSIPREVQEEQSRRSRELLRGAMVEGHWEPYLADLHEQGAGYARMGLSFPSWFRALSVIRPLIIGRLRSAYG